MKKHTPRTRTVHVVFDNTNDRLKLVIPCYPSAVLPHVLPVLTDEQSKALIGVLDSTRTTWID